MPADTHTRTYRVTDVLLLALCGVHVAVVAPCACAPVHVLHLDPAAAGVVVVATVGAGVGCASPLWRMCRERCTCDDRLLGSIPSQQETDTGRCTRCHGRAHCLQLLEQTCRELIIT
jgi:hypothetical protein